MLMTVRFLLMAVLLPLPLLAKSEGKVYHDSRGHAIRFPLGELSFADEVVSFAEGKLSAKTASARKAEEALRPPDFSTKKDRNYVTLGCGGALHDSAARIRTMPEAKIIVQGHTDSVGTDAANQKLSLARAASVRRYLVSDERVDASAIVAKGYGESRPIASNDSADGREKNRVEILVIPGQ